MMDILRIVLTIICLLMVAYLIYDGRKMRQLRQLSIAESLKTLSWYCLKHGCDDCKLQMDGECFGNKTPCDWINLTKGGDTK